MMTNKVVLAICLAWGVLGCSSMSTTEKRTLTGGGIGAASGAVIGELATGRPLEGAAIGAAAGLASGWLYDRHEKAQE